MDMDDAFRGETVFVTGHTGFKGSWLCEWLLVMGARVHGYALDPPTHPSLFDQLRLGERIAMDRRGDVRDLPSLRQAIHEAAPAYLFHLAAQPIVRASYDDPLGTIETNVLGTAHVLEALRRAARPCVAIVVTTDKCYENREWVYGYRENDPLGGRDPYSASKACAEILVSSYGRSFFSASGDRVPEGGVSVASVRAGNVVGGGDWAADRIVPDCIRHLGAGSPVPVRNPLSIRPWQHVLEPLGGYLRLAAEIRRCLDAVPPDDRRLRTLCAAFNFGPSLQAERTVRDLVREILRHWPGTWEDRSDPQAPHEAGRLFLAIDRAHDVLGWHPRWDFARTVEETIRWYRETEVRKGDGEFAIDLTRSQIRSYQGLP